MVVTILEKVSLVVVLPTNINLFPHWLQTGACFVELIEFDIFRGYYYTTFSLIMYV